jgi:hypothetical protein
MTSVLGRASFIEKKPWLWYTRVSNKNLDFLLNGLSKRLLVVKIQ